MMDRSVTMIENHARFVLVIDKHGFPVSYNKKESYGLNIIAVIGGSVINGTLFSRTVLLEIGIWRTKPYRSANAPMGYVEKRLNLRYRTKGGNLTDEQWGNLAPFINDIITAEARRVTEQWKSSEPWVVPVGDTWKTYERGVCFSCSFEDHALLASIIRADRTLRENLADRAKFINDILRRLKYAIYPDTALKRMTSVGKVAESLRKNPVAPYHYSFLERQITKQVLFRDIADVFKLVDFERVHYFDQFLKAHPHKVRFTDGTIRIKMEREEKGFLVFEFIPHKI